ncbi:hypothetical protein J437_LFUL004266 [Ladona fulva]|uniref:Uncharacterized protein n=1 Tax=Ladona fulva TaxID=123851 RepID=A0A8K0P260_LADFU|nr:hypothetical protein J437_LFUL004266 [Ladona fulva]
MQNYQQHPVFPGGHPSKYYPGPTMLNFGDRTRTGVFIVVWPLARTNELRKEFIRIECYASSRLNSEAVTHPSTIRALRCLTSVIGREPVFSSWYGRWRERTR